MSHFDAYARSWALLRHRLYDRGMKTISTSEVLVAHQQLLPTVRELPAPTATSPRTLTKAAPSIEEIDDRIGPDGKVNVVENIPVTFFLDTLDGRLVWRFEGKLAVLEGDAEEARGFGGLSAWVQAEFGGRCRRADVGEPIDTVSVAVLYFA